MSRRRDEESECAHAWPHRSRTKHVIKSLPIIQLVVIELQACVNCVIKIFSLLITGRAVAVAGGGGYEAHRSVTQRTLLSYDRNS